MRGPSLVLFSIFIALIAAAPLSSGQQTPEEGPMLHMIEYSYVPDPVEVAPGGTVILMNFGPEDQSLPKDQWGEFAHTVTAVDGSFDVQQIPPDFAARPMQAPATPGTYPYYCRYHGDTAGNGMVGTLVVNASLAAPPASASPATTPGTPTVETSETSAGWLVLTLVGAAAAGSLRRPRAR